MKKLQILSLLLPTLFFAQQEFSEIKIKSWSPTIYLQRSYLEGGFTQGIQTQLMDGTNNWYFGNLGTGEWRVSKGNWENSKFSIIENGNIGIGTTNPQAKLEIYGGGDLALKGATEDAGDLIFQQNTGKQNARIWSSEQGGLFFSGSDSNPKITLIDNGNFGIGTTNPQAKLDVNGNISIASGYPIQLAGNQPYHGIQYSNNGFANTFVDGPVLYGWSGGGLGIKKEIGEWLALKWNAEGNVAVSNKLEAKEIKVTTTPTADFVFEDSYQLPNLESVEKHIKEKKHLPEIASAAEMQKEGVNIGDFQIKLLQKIEELTLYQIQLNKEVTSLKQENIQLKETLQKIQNHEKSY
ncbi:calcium-binding protein [Elizabethkingia ursingii]|uniref:calcium-binding protein n=1 Tax=Elizabethkingia ursingii TaxID=1756150 RepID=UPI0007519024|nr:calcium-binding protein [Elizabethkingia ursingii]KUY30849.1 hypothetical protein ATB96_13255 [Elizabethkingia ursingii]